MIARVRLLAFALLLGFLVVVLVVLGCRGGTMPAGTAMPPEAETNLIAYVTEEGQVVVMNPDGTSPVRISPEEGFFTWPLWSPDASQIGFSGAPIQDEVRSPLTLYVYYLDDERLQVVHMNDRQLGPILTGMPHYPIWSPDSKHLAFMAGATQGLTLFLVNPRTETEAEVLLRTAPLYASWSADSKHIIVHGGVEHFMVDIDETTTVRDLVPHDARYRVPAWWPLGQRLTFVTREGAGPRQLYLSDISGEERVVVDQLLGDVAFLWSPDGQSLAVSEGIGGFFFQNIRLFDADGVPKQIAIDDRVMAFFWSPDSTKLAYATMTDEPGTFRWNVLYADDGDTRELVDFTPSDDQLTLLAFFDQFAYSHSPWSPDSRALVFAGTLPGSSVTISHALRQHSQVFVLDVGPSPSVEAIADGVLAVWSPR